MGMRTSFRNRAKVKFYYGIKGNSLADAEEKSAKLGEEVLAMIDAIL